jgi:hypothetical protein
MFSGSYQLFTTTIDENATGTAVSDRLFFRYKLIYILTGNFKQLHLCHFFVRYGKPAVFSMVFWHVSTVCGQLSTGSCGPVF